MSNHFSFKTRFTRHFLQALVKIVKKRGAIDDNKPSSSTAVRLSRYRKVRIAADASMALAARPGRAWRHALLWKVRGQRVRWGPSHRYLRQAMVMRRRTSSDHHGVVGGKKRTKRIVEDGGEEERLRKAVPGGEAMELYRLLEETGDYIKCLASQVQVMTTIANLISAANAN